ncbi:MAG: dockerin type I domain-containing protein [Dehalococcoidia bacterium]
MTIADNTVKVCDGSGGLGTQVWVDNIAYGHLASFAPSVVKGALLLQGDAIGIQGNTGNTLPPTCGVHLHWKFSDAGYGAPLPAIDGGSSTTSNSLIGDYNSTAGATLRAYYQSHGGWNSIGWTVQHCPGACTLDMTANRTWGRMQDFQHDPDGFGGTFDTVHVANANPSQAYLVDSVFWQAWAAGGRDNNGALHPLAMAIGERGPCPSWFSSACISYQPFQLGFVWMDVFTGRTAEFCPDNNGDGEVNILDLSNVATYYNQPAPPPPARLVDINGDGWINILDLAAMSTVYNKVCRV